jgi:hypothetical protein
MSDIYPPVPICNAVKENSRLTLRGIGDITQSLAIGWPHRETAALSSGRRSHVQLNGVNIFSRRAGA